MKWQLPFIKSVAELFHRSAPSSSQFWLFFLLLLSLWWLPFSALLEDKERIERQSVSIGLKAKRDERQRQALAKWLPSEQLDIHIEKVLGARNQVSQLKLNGKASLSQWRQVFESLQRIAEYQVIEMNWWRKSGGWKAELQLEVLSIKVNPLVYDWLPVLNVANDRLNMSEVHLVGSFQQGNQQWSKIEYMGKSVWAKYGDWIPVIRSTLLEQTRGNVTLEKTNGDIWTIPEKLTPLTLGESLDG